MLNSNMGEANFGRLTCKAGPGRRGDCCEALRSEGYRRGELSPLLPHSVPDLAAYAPFLTRHRIRCLVAWGTYQHSLFHVPRTTIRLLFGTYLEIFDAPILLRRFSRASASIRTSRDDGFPAIRARSNWMLLIEAFCFLSCRVKARRQDSPNPLPLMPPVVAKCSTLRVLLS